VAAEQTLALSLTAIAERIAAQVPGAIARSYEQAWRPSTLDRIARQDAEAAASLAWARRVARSLDSSLIVAERATRARTLEARASALGHDADSLRTALARGRDTVARRAIERSLAALEPEREGIEYGLAASAWAVAASLDRAAEGTSDTSSIRESDEAAGWRNEGIARLQAYLANHPAGEGRADARYRLADLLEQRARVAFRGRMEQYLQSPSGAVPVLETAPSIALHRAILRDDPGFPHRDAVLFDLGTLLAETGDPEATRHFRELVDAHPGSPLAQESWLRLADEAFDERRYADAAPLYRSAVTGADTTLRVIALYKLGWTEFHEDHFAQATTAFGGCWTSTVTGTWTRASVSMTTPRCCSSTRWRVPAARRRSRSTSTALVRSLTNSSCCARWASTSASTRCSPRRWRRTSC
jgi:TolA-binding protein